MPRCFIPSNTFFLNTFSESLYSTGYLFLVSIVNSSTISAITFVFLMASKYFSRGIEPCLSYAVTNSS